MSCPTVHSLSGKQEGDKEIFGIFADWEICQNATEQKKKPEPRRRWVQDVES